jgi:hypothetical protein
VSIQNEDHFWMDTIYSAMSAKYPLCPLSDHRNCRECENPNLCAIVRADGRCLKKIQNNRQTEPTTTPPTNQACAAAPSEADD